MDFTERLSIQLLCNRTVRYLSTHQLLDHYPPPPPFTISPLRWVLLQLVYPSLNTFLQQWNISISCATLEKGVHSVSIPINLSPSSLKSSEPWLSPRPAFAAVSKNILFHPPAESKSYHLVLKKYLASVVTFFASYNVDLFFELCH